MLTCPKIVPTVRNNNTPASVINPTQAQMDFSDLDLVKHVTYEQHSSEYGRHARIADHHEVGPQPGERAVEIGIEQHQVVPSHLRRTALGAVDEPASVLGLVARLPARPPIGAQPRAQDLEADRPQRHLVAADPDGEGAGLLEQLGLLRIGVFHAQSIALHDETRADVTQLDNELFADSQGAPVGRRSKDQIIEVAKTHERWGDDVGDAIRILSISGGAGHNQ